MGMTAPSFGWWYVNSMIGAAWLWSILYNLSRVLWYNQSTYRLGSTQCGPPVPDSNLPGSTEFGLMNTFLNVSIPFLVMCICYSRILYIVIQAGKSVDK